MKISAITKGNPQTKRNTGNFSGEIKNKLRILKPGEQFNVYDDRYSIEELQARLASTINSFVKGSSKKGTIHTHVNRDNDCVTVYRDYVK